MQTALNTIFGNTICDELFKRLSPEQIAMIEKAYAFSQKAHQGQLRASGHPYILHCIEVVKILCELCMDTESICVGFLHDVLEDTSVNFEELKKEFTPNIATLVEGVTKISALKFSSNRERHIESLRKMLLAMASDIRVIIIKLADRLHNMRTLRYLAEEKRLLISRHTLEIYAPLANRLGMTRIKSELEDLSMYYLYPKEYREIAQKVRKKKDYRDDIVQKTIKFLKNILAEHNIPAEIQGRPKHFYSIYHKMKSQNLSFDQIYDLIALRVITDDVAHCYDIVGLIHSIWKPVPGRFKDYIALPKENMYQSIHTTVLGFEGEMTEFQIRTTEMHKVAEEGIAAHWKYKENVKEEDADFEKKLLWLRQLTEWIREVQDPDEFYDAVKKDVFSDTVFCFTPKGDIIELPAGATALDFAYYIHTQVGDHCIGAVVNKKIVPLRYKLQNYDMLKITTSKTGHPSADWLDIVKTSRARSKIRHWLKTKNFDLYVNLGRESLLKALKIKNIQVNLSKLSETFEPFFKTYAVLSFDELCLEIGFKGISAQNVVNKLLLAQGKEIQTKRQKKIFSSSKGVLIENIDDALVRFSRCCNPLPGDDILGFITRGRGVSIHKQDCPSLKHIISENEGNGESRIVSAHWDATQQSQRLIELKILSRDRKGLLADISQIISKMNITIMGSTTKTTDDRLAYLNFYIPISSTEELKELLDKISQVKGVMNIAHSFRSPSKDIDIITE